jgi:hypothetical protein
MDKELDIERSQALGQTMGAPAKQPWQKAYRAALSLPEAEYVQGFLVVPGAPFRPLEHAWLELENSRIDPNLSHQYPSPSQRFYFPAQRLSLTQLKAAITAAQEDYPEDDPLPIYGSMPYEYYGDVMLGGQEYASAYQSAKAKCRELNPVKKAHSSSGA